MKFVKSFGWKGAVFWGVGCFDFSFQRIVSCSFLSHDARISRFDGSSSSDRFNRLCRFFARSLHGLPFYEGIKTCRHRSLLNLMFNAAGCSQQNAHCRISGCDDDCAFFSEFSAAAFYNVAALSICARSIQTNFCELCCLASDDGAVRGICLCVGFVHSFHG